MEEIKVQMTVEKSTGNILSLVSAPQGLGTEVLQDAGDWESDLKSDFILSIDLCCDVDESRRMIVQHMTGRYDASRLNGYFRLDVGGLSTDAVVGLLMMGRACCTDNAEVLSCIEWVDGMDLDTFLEMEPVIEWPSEPSEEETI